MIYWSYYFLILLLGGGGLITGVIYLHRLKLSRPFFENLTLACLALFLMLMALEFYLNLFFAESHAHDTLARRNWYRRYYQNADNSLGYRDREWTDGMLQGKIKVMVVGDSFVEGVGIENPEDRFSNRLAQKLGPQYVVLNLGNSGSNTSGQIEALVDHPYKPDILIWSYTVNDIEGVAGPLWLKKPPDHYIHPLLLPLVEHSHLINFVYWRLYGLLTVDNHDLRWEWYLDIYNDPEAWWRHQQELLSIHKGAQAEQIPLLVVVFPGLTALEESKVVTDRVVTLFREKGVPVVDVSKLVNEVPVKDRIASLVDPHPSELVNELVAEALYQEFLAIGLSSRQNGYLYR